MTNEDTFTILNFPTPADTGLKPGDPLPKTFVEITLKVTGAGMKEGEEMTIQFEKMTLNQPDQMRVEAHEKFSELPHWDDITRMPDRDLTYSLHLNHARLSDETQHAFTVTYPDHVGNIMKRMSME